MSEGVSRQGTLEGRQARRGYWEGRWLYFLAAIPLLWLIFGLWRRACPSLAALLSTLQGTGAFLPWWHGPISLSLWRHLLQKAGENKSKWQTGLVGDSGFCFLCLVLWRNQCCSSNCSFLHRNKSPRPFPLAGFQADLILSNTAWLLYTTSLLITLQLLEDVRSLILLSKLYLYGTYVTQQVCKAAQLQKQSVLGSTDWIQSRSSLCFQLRLHLLTQITAHVP